MNTHLLAELQSAGLTRACRVFEVSVGYPLLELDHPRFQEAYALLSCHWANWSMRWECYLAVIEDQVHLVFTPSVEPSAAPDLSAQLKSIEELLQ
jgi:hypothetical protein